MNIEYVCSKTSSVRWLHSEYLRRNISDQERFWMCGSYGSKPTNLLSIWTNLPNDTADVGDATNNLSGIFKVKGIADYPVAANVVNIVNYDKRSVVVSLANGDILWLRFSREGGFELAGQIPGKGLQLVNHQTTGHYVNDYNEIISGGLDGTLRFIDLEKETVVRSATVTANSVHCLDKISPTEVVTGTTSGHVKVFDKREDKVAMSLANELSVITAIQRNSHIPHIIAAANDLGFLYLWDLRNGGHRPMQPSSAHSAAINTVRYAEHQPNLLYTASVDGQLIKWNISNDFELVSVEAIIDKSNPYPITAFDINANNQLVFADDNEVLYLSDEQV